MSVTATIPTGQAAHGGDFMHPSVHLAVHPLFHLLNKHLLKGFYAQIFLLVSGCRENTHLSHSLLGMQT